MALAGGTRLGPYEILAPLGAGGMGEVYRACDTRLERTVAIKVLPPHLSSNPELRQRFEREARTISSLNHPHICTLHDIGHQDGVDFLVMEYLEGETLAQRLQKGPLSTEQVLRYAIQITDALDKAHRQGVTHRDLKPANIMLTKTGAKLLDFGLAKFRPAEPVMDVGATVSELPSADRKLTMEGTILGTFQYMAPEQLEGKEADARSDIFAFGVVLYEMLTGRPPFGGRSKASLIAAILEHEPAPLSTLQPMTPPALERVVNTCLAKDPEERWQTAHDLKVQLQWIAEGGSQLGVPAPVVARRKSRERLAWVLVAALATISAALGAWSFLRAPRVSQPVRRLVVTLPPSEPLADLSMPAVALVPDGSRMVYVARHGSTTALYLRGMNQFQAPAIPGTEGASIPFFSPDGQWVGFFAGGKLKKVSLSGGAPMTLCDAPLGRGASWGADDTIIFAPTNRSGLMRVQASGGAPQALTSLDTKKNEMSHRFPEILPGGKAVVFTVEMAGASFDDAHIAVQSLETGRRRTLLESGSNGRYALSGHLVYGRAGSLLALTFDPARLETKGTPFPILEGVTTNASLGAAQFSLSTDGSLVYVPGIVQLDQRSLVWVDRKGEERPLTEARRFYQQPRLAPDGRRLAVVIVDGANSDIWVYDLARDTLTRLTFAPGQDTNPVWTPDGKRITYASNEKGGSTNLFWKPADGSGPEERLTTSTNTQTPASWSPDGKVLAFQENGPTGGWDIWLLPLEGDPPRRARPFLQAPFNEGDATFSPDGRWLAYVSNESGQAQVYVQPFPGPGGKWQISPERGGGPLWGRNGRELFYRDLMANKVMAVDISTQPSFSAGKPRALFERLYLPAYDVAPDGQRFLMLKAGQQASAPTQLNVVLNWFEELKRRAPASNQ